MSILTPLCHQAIVRATAFGNTRFRRSLNNLEQVQREILNKLLHKAEATAFGQKAGLCRELSYEQMAQSLPVTEYDQWREWIDEQRANRGAQLSTECDRYQPTSGSTASVKWIPYSKALLNEFDQAISPWMHSTALEHPGMLKGKHYWSLSWLPNNLRNQLDNTSDLELFPWWKRFVLAQTMTVPNSIALTPTSEAATFATMAYLAGCSDLSFISVWSPTFALNLLEQIENQRFELAKILEFGEWAEWKEQMGTIRCPRNKRAAKLLRGWDGKNPAEFFPRLWPKLCLLSAWETAGSKEFARQLQEKLPVPLQGKGLWATEAVVTIPYHGRYPLALTSHFYEFKCLQTGNILPSWKLESEQVVQPIITTGSGLWRYALRDRLKVTDFLQQTPCFEFLGRLDGCDMVGEKISPELATDVLHELTKDTGNHWISMIAVPPTASGGGKPFYVLLGQGEAKASQPKCQLKAEDLLCRMFHYRLARELGQLDPCRILLTDDARGTYMNMVCGDNAIAGNVKFESVALLKNPMLNFEDGFDAAVNN